MLNTAFILLSFYGCIPVQHILGVFHARYGRENVMEVTVMQDNKALYYGDVFAYGVAPEGYYFVNKSTRPGSRCDVVEIKK